MARFVLFCTSQRATTVVERFIKEATRVDIAKNCWIVARDPSQEFQAQATPLPIEPFETGFEGMSREALANQISDWKKTLPQPGMYVPETMFFELDQRSADDDTILVHHLIQKMPEGFEDDWYEDKVVETWVTWRIKFIVAWGVTAALITRPDTLYNGFFEGPDEHGVVHDAFIEKAIVLDDGTIKAYTKGSH